jgi:hypothetical protein
MSAAHPRPTLRRSACGPPHLADRLVVMDAARAERLRRLERQFSLPGDFINFLRFHREDGGDRRAVLQSNPGRWGLSRLFEMSDGANHVQLDSVLTQVGDVIPSGMVPVGEDEGGNFYLLDTRIGPAFGSVSWWDHERDLGDHHVELVAPSFTDFLDQVGPETD